MLNAPIHKRLSLMLNQATKMNKRAGTSTREVTQIHFGEALPRVLIAIAPVITASGSTKRTLRGSAEIPHRSGLVRSKGLKATKRGKRRCANNDRCCDDTVRHEHLKRFPSHARDGYQTGPECVGEPDKKSDVYDEDCIEDENSRRVPGEIAS